MPVISAWPGLKITYVLWIMTENFILWRPLDHVAIRYLSQDINNKSSQGCIIPFYISPRIVPMGEITLCSLFSHGAAQNESISLNSWIVIIVLRRLTEYKSKYCEQIVHTLHSGHLIRLIFCSGKIPNPQFGAGHNTPPPCRTNSWVAKNWYLLYWKTMKWKLSERMW